MGRKNKQIKFLKFPPMKNFDTCTICGSHNGPWTWVEINNQICFLCDECYDKYFATLFNKPEDTRG